MLVESLTTPLNELPHQKLSDRELQTLVMIASGKRLADIAEELMLSPKTVSVYRARVLEKLQLANNSELTVYAIRNGLVGLNESDAAPPLDDPQAIRQADRDLLSLALIDARNLTLRWLEVFESRASSTAQAAGDAPHRAGWPAMPAWYQEWWIGRNPQRKRGARADPHCAWRRSNGTPTPGSSKPADGERPRPTPCVRLPGRDAGHHAGPAGRPTPPTTTLHFFRAALLHEDRVGEHLAEIAAALQLRSPSRPAAPWLWPPPRCPTARRCGCPPHACTGRRRPAASCPTTNAGPHTVSVPEFEIDAQAVSWERYIEFAEDGGYDRRELWTDTGWDWLQPAPPRAARR
jgi:iron(II)-dependent oxidoreductase